MAYLEGIEVVPGVGTATEGSSSKQKDHTLHHAFVCQVEKGLVEMVLVEVERTVVAAVPVVE